MAKQFWTAAIGCDVVMDESYDDERWIEVEAPIARSCWC
jgi:hypothetical protein